MAKGGAGTSMIRQTMFSTGEVDAQNFKRTDVKEYLTAAQSLLNCEVGTTGLVKKRKGSTQVGNVTGQAQLNSRMYEFVDNNGNHYIIISADGMFYVYQAFAENVDLVTGRGTFVVTGSGAQVIVGDFTVDFIQGVAWPYQFNDLANLDYTSDNDSIIFTNSKFPPGRIYISQYNGAAPPTFAYQVINIFPYPVYDFNAINYNNYAVVLTVSGSTLTFEFQGVGATNPGFGQGSNSVFIGGQILGAGAISPGIGEAIITAVDFFPVEDGGTVVFTATVLQPFLTTNYATLGSQYSVKQPAWSAALGYPAKVLYFQNRLWMANTPTLKTTIFGSKINQPINFDVGTGADTDAIVYTLGQSDSGEITWMNGGKQMEIFTSNYEFTCPQNENQALTPATFAVRQQSSFGTSVILKPLSYINDSYYVNKSGKSIINFHFTGVGLSYQAANISAASSHLVKNPQNRALLRGSDSSQDNFIYFLNPKDSSLTTFQFANEYKLAALSPTIFQEDVDIIDIVTVQNVVYLLKYYVLTQTFTIESFDDTTRIDGNITKHMATDGVVTGLEIYNGYLVQVLYQGQDFGQYLVVNGTITVTDLNLVSGAVQVGLLYDVDLTPMFIYAGQQNSPFKKVITRIYVDYYLSLDFKINGTFVPYQNFADIQAGLGLTPQTGTAIIDVSDGWERFGKFSITQTSPFDLQILSIGYQVAGAVI